MSRKSLLKKINQALNPDGTQVDFTAFDQNIEILKKSLKEKIQVKTLDDVNNQIEKFRQKIDLKPLTDAMAGIKTSFIEETDKLSQQIQEKTDELETLFAKKGESKSAIQDLNNELSDLKLQLSSLEIRRKGDIEAINGQIQEVKNFNLKSEGSINQILGDLDVIRETEAKGEEIGKEAVKELQISLEKVRSELMTRIANIGGGALNRQMFINGVDPLTKYTDVNLKAGANTTISYANNDTTKKVDITFTATGGGSGSVVGVPSIGGLVIGGANRDVLFIHPSSVLAQDTLFQWDTTTTQLQLGQPTVFDGNSQETLTIGNNINNYSGIYVQNNSTGDTNSTDIILGADNDSTAVLGHYLDLGTHGSGFSGASPALGIIKTFSVNAAGSGYTAGDIVTITGGSGDGQINILTVNGSGVPLTTSIANNGTNYTITNGVTTSGGTGSGFIINILTLFDFTIFTPDDTFTWSSGGDHVMLVDDGILGKAIKFAVDGTSTKNEVGRFTSSVLTLGNTGSVAGQIYFKGKTSGTTLLNVPSVAGAYTLVLPPNTGTINQSLQTDGNGITFWGSVAGVGGSGITRSVSVISVSSTFAAVAKTDYVAFANVGIKITLPTAVGNSNQYTVKNSSASSVVVLTTGGETIDDGASALLTTQYQALDFISNNSVWGVV